MNLAMYDFDGTYVNVQTVPHLFKCFNEKGSHKKTYADSKLETSCPIYDLKIIK